MTFDFIEKIRKDAYESVDRSAVTLLLTENEKQTVYLAVEQMILKIST